MRPTWIAAFALILLASAHVSAQCAEGRVVTPETAGRCCWPGQHWSASDARCEGPPTCPSGWIAEGDTCLDARDTMVQAPPASYGDPTLSQPAETAWPGWRRPSTPTRFEPWLELMWAGVITGTVGYVFSIVAGIVEATQCCLNDPWPWFVPLAGPVLYPVVDHSVFASVLAAAIPASAVQLAGLVMLLVGGLARRPVYGSPAVGPGPGTAGISLRWDL